MKKRPNRKAQKTQVTIRIDTELLGEATGHAKNQGLRLTDALEQGLLLWLTRGSDAPLPRQVRLLAQFLPLALQRETMRYWGYRLARFGDSHHAVQHFLEKLMEQTEKDPAVKSAVDQALDQLRGTEKET